QDRVAAARCERPLRGGAGGACGRRPRARARKEGAGARAADGEYAARVRRRPDAFDRAPGVARAAPEPRVRAVRLAGRRARADPGLRAGEARARLRLSVARAPEESGEIGRQRAHDLAALASGGRRPGEPVAVQRVAREMQEGEILGRELAARALQEELLVA